MSSSPPETAVPEVVDDEGRLRELYAEPGDRAIRKVQDHLDRHCRDFIAHSPFLCIGSSRPDGHADVSPRGDPPGFVLVVDDHTLLIPDRPGNNRLDTVTNLFRNPRVGLLFFIPGYDETLRVNGDARIVRDDATLRRFAHRGHVPKVAIEVTVAEAFLHCGKALKRSHLWDDASRIDRDSFTRPSQIFADHVKGGMSPDEVEAHLERSYRDRLYGKD